MNTISSSSVPSHVISATYFGISSAPPERTPFLTSSGYRVVMPYKHVYSMTTKGRWDGLSLWEVFTREFAVVDDEVDVEDKLTLEERRSLARSQRLGTGTVAAKSDVETCEAPPPSVSTHFMYNSLVYANKMANGKLWMVGRREECRTAGEAYRRAIRRLLGCGDETQQDGSGVSSSFDAATADADEWYRAVNTCVMMGETNGSIAALRQVDAIRHLVLRREHVVCMSGESCRYGLVTALSHTCNDDASAIGVQCIDVFAIERPPSSLSSPAAATPSSPPPPPCFIAVSKPSSVSIHPGGKFHDNTLTRILEDAFCGTASSSSSPSSMGGGGGEAISKSAVSTKVAKHKQSAGTFKHLAACENEPIVATTAVPNRQFLIVEGRPLKGSPNAPPNSTFICEPVILSAEEEEERRSAHDCRRAWFPVIRLPHSLSQGAIEWLLSHLGRETVVEYDSTAHTVLGLQAASVVPCGLVPLHAKQKTSTATEASTTEGGAHGGGDPSANEKPPQVHVPPLKLYVVHRIDRCTSGVVVLATDGPSAKLITQTLTDGTASNNASDPSGGGGGPQSQSITVQSSISSSSSPISLNGAAESQASTPSLNTLSLNASAAHKRYLARCHGDVRKLLALVASFGLGGRENPTACSTVRFSDGGDAPISCLLINTPTYCASHQSATYWCFGTRALQEQFEAEEEAKKTHQPRNSGAAPPFSLTADASAAVIGEKRARDGEQGGHTADAEEGPLSSRFAGLKYAKTIVRFLSYDAANDTSLLQCYPLTGRTHQIRIHLASNGFPIVGDTKYYSRGVAAGIGGVEGRCDEKASEYVAMDGRFGAGGGKDSSLTDDGVGEDASAICLHAVSYSIPIATSDAGEKTRVLESAWPLWAV